MGKKTVRFACHHCLHCCTDVVCLPTPWDVIRIVRETRERPKDFLEFLTADEISGVAKSDPTWLKCNGTRYIMALRRGKKGCYFLSRKHARCKIYEARPILCRLYPFKLHETRSGKFKGFSLHTDVECPRHRNGVVPTAPLYTLYLDDKTHQEDYEDLVRVFNARRSSDKRPKDFIKLFVKGR